MNKKILFLIGSPKTEAESASALVETYFMKFLRKKSFETERINIVKTIKKEEHKKKLLNAVNNSDILVFVSPVYLDTVPSSITESMEFLNKNKHLMYGSKKMIAVSVCGYPEALHNDTALQIYKCFANHMRFAWIGGLGIGEGPAYVYTRQALSIFGLHYRLKKSISLIVKALVEEKTISKEAMELAKKSIIPNWFYTWLAIFIVKILASKDGVRDLYRRPYAL